MPKEYKEKMAEYFENCLPSASHFPKVLLNQRTVFSQSMSIHFFKRILFEILLEVSSNLNRLE